MKIKTHANPEERTLTWDDTFHFKCHDKIDCYNSCCANVTILLNPLDVVRMRKALGITSTQFLSKYTVRLEAEKTGIPAVALKMSDDEKKTCPLVSAEGCSVYDARPYSCRLYPLDTDEGVEYRIIVDSDKCHGLRETEEWTVELWREKQGLHAYDDLDHNLKDVMHAEAIWEAPILNPKMRDMLYMALYDVDRFREFVFESSFLTKFQVDEDILERIRKDDEAMLYFAGEWLRFALFGKKEFLKFDKDYLDAKKKQVLGL